jgi:RluA family pseudouridine synthase
MSVSVGASSKGRRALGAPRKDFGLITDEQLAETELACSNGLRFARPYMHAFTANCKQRWVGESVLEVLVREFVGLSRADFERAIAQRRVLLSGQPVVPERVFRDGDVLSHVTHRHEAPVVGTPLRLLPHADADGAAAVIAVDKPPSIPVHPGGRYRHLSLTFLLAREHGLRRLFIAHRLDRLTSGVVLFGATTEAAAGLAKLISTGQTRKCYLALVRGNLHAAHAAFLRVDQPIVVRGGYEGVCSIGPDGKRSVTLLRSVCYDAARDVSVALCLPLTGRTHQIRVHLEHVGFPIANDPLYLSVAQHPQRSDGLHHRKRAVPEDADAGDTHASSSAASASPFHGDTRDYCLDCTAPEPDPTSESLLIFLHAYSYLLRRPDAGWPAALPFAGESAKFESGLPAWASASGATAAAIDALLDEFEALPVAERSVCDDDGGGEGAGE